MEMFASWNSYPSIYALGHAAIADIFNEEIIVEEKVDGSQLSFGLFPDGLRARSKGAQIQILAPMAMFKPAVDVVQSLDLHPGWTYRAEFLAKPKHNVLCYDRIPAKHLIIFDINTGNESYLGYEEKAAEAARLGLEVVPLLFKGKCTDIEMFRSFLDRTSILGGQKIEGVVVKNYARFGRDKKVMLGKFVSEAFKEVHASEWKSENPKQGDILELLVREYKTPARWSKALQHLRESGKIEDSPKDIGLLFPEAQSDLEAECRVEILEKLWKWAWPQLKRRCVHGLAEWYKEQLLQRAFQDVRPAQPIQQ